MALSGSPGACVFGGSSAHGNHPLSADSAHPPSLHFTWPKMQLFRLRRLCSSVREMEEDRAVVYSEVRYSLHPSKSVMNAISNVNIYARAPAIPVSHLGAADAALSVWWLGVGYHPAARRALGPIQVHQEI